MSSQETPPGAAGDEGTTPGQPAPQDAAPPESTSTPEVSPEQKAAASEETAAAATPKPEPGASSAAGAPPAKPPRSYTVTLPHSKGRLFLLGLAGVAALLAFVVVVISVFAFAESTAFCTTCHSMDPEKTTHDISAHQRTDCGTCHIGPGAVPAILAKFQNVKYIWEYPTGHYPKPIPSPIHSLRPAEVTCEQCHWPEKFYSDKIAEIPGHASDEKSTPSNTQMVLHTGGGSSATGQGRGIHWHIENPVYYIAADEERQDIPWIQATYNGITTTYTSISATMTQEQIDKAEKRTMDCIDCHNRATHDFRNPSDSLDAALTGGAIPADLPYIKREGDKVLMKKYATVEEGTSAMVTVGDWYRVNYPDLYAARKADVDKAVAGLQTIFEHTQFPAMKAYWDTHNNNVGHLYSAGCMRCHDGNHFSADKQAVRLECNLCHTIPQVTTGNQPLPPLPMSTGPEPASHMTTTWIAQHKTAFDNTCAGCHTVTDPGGTSNTSFCSNSACHGTEWTYLNLNAPQIRATQPQPTPAAAGSPTKAPAAATAAPAQSPATTAPSQPAATAAPTKPAATAAPAAGGPPAIPHAVAGRENCLQCHDPNTGIKPAPKDHAGRAVGTCQACHKPSQ